MVLAVGILAVRGVDRWVFCPYFIHHAFVFTSLIVEIFKDQFLASPSPIIILHVMIFSSFNLIVRDILMYFRTKSLRLILHIDLNLLVRRSWRV